MPQLDRERFEKIYQAWSSKSRFDFKKLSEFAWKEVLIPVYTPENAPVTEKYTEPERWPTSEYLGEALQRRWRSILIDKLAIYLREKSHLFDAIAFRGMSGALIGPSLADKLDKKLIMVRKPTDGESHSRMTVEGEKADRYIIVDDFVSSGSTVRAIMKAVYEAKFTTHKPVAVVCYRVNCGRSHKDVDGIPIWGLE